MVTAMAAIVLVLALALMIYRSGSAALNWQIGENDPIIKFYPAGDDLYVISSSNISMVDGSGKALWTIPFANAQYSTMWNNSSLYVYSTDRGLNIISQSGAITQLTGQGMNHPPIVGEDGMMYLRSWSLLSAVSPSGIEAWNVSNVISDPVVDRDDNIYFFVRPPDNISSVYLYCMSPGGILLSSTYYEKYNAGTALMAGQTGGVFVYDEPSGIFYHVNTGGNVTWDHSMTYLGQFNMAEDEKGRIYLLYLWGTVHVIDERNVLLSKFNPVVTYNANLTYQPVAYDDTVYVVGDDKYQNSMTLYSLNVDGTLKWKLQFNSSASPAIYTGKDVVCIATESRSDNQLTPMLYVIGDKGVLKFTYKSGDGSPWDQVYVGQDDTVFARTNDGRLYALKG